jgi:hypothetical protein
MTQIGEKAESSHTPSMKIKYSCMARPVTNLISSPLRQLIYIFLRRRGFLSRIMQKMIIFRALVEDAGIPC